MQIYVEKLQSPCPSTDASSQFHLENNLRTGNKSQILLLAVYSRCSGYVTGFWAKELNSQSSSSTILLLETYGSVWKSKGDVDLHCGAMAESLLALMGPCLWLCWVGSSASQCTRRAPITSADMSLIRTGCINRSGVRKKADLYF